MLNFRVLILFICFVSLYIFEACGVKGKPQPPAKLPYIGQGINGSPTINKDSIKELNEGKTIN
jgi:hypothetical protein